MSKTDQDRTRISCWAATSVGALLVGLWLLSVSGSRLSWALIGEDRFVEWASAWSCFVAGGFFLRSNWGTKKIGRQVWAHRIVLASICIFIALEEISWGQRIFGYQPDVYFLANNVQQEANLHNVLGPLLRDALFLLFVVGYGIVLPVLRGLTRQFQSLAPELWSIAPPNSLVFIFGLIVILYAFPASWMSQELAEFGLALSLLVSAVQSSYLRSDKRTPLRSQVATLFVTLAFVVCASLISEWVTSMPRTSSPKSIAQARNELVALRQDFLAFKQSLGGKMPKTLGLDERLYQFQKRLGQYSPTLRTYNLCFEGNQELNRAEYLLDPWNSPYWIVDTYQDGSRRMNLLSYGPNRRRDFGPTQPSGDDILLEVLNSN